MIHSHSLVTGLFLFVCSIQVPVLFLPDNLLPERDKSKVSPENILPFELLISEIMADPSPTIGLPPYEYIEIFNGSNKTINLYGLTLDFESRFCRIDRDDFILEPGQYFIFCEQEAYPALSLFGPAMGLNGWPGIRNSHGSLSLFHQNRLIHRVSYVDEWYRDSRKKNGGWSLEMINTSNWCDLMNNWTASTDTAGGSPGRKNAVEDQSFKVDPALDSVVVSGDRQIIVYVNKQIQEPSATDLVFSPVIDEATIIAGADLQSFRILLQTPLIAGRLYRLSISLRDCTGRFAGMYTANFTKPETIKKNDLIINEILFNPEGQGSDFVELYNRSGKVLFLKGWTLENKMNRQKRAIGPNSYLLPGGYLVLSPDPKDVSFRFKKVQMDFLILQDLPALADGTGQLNISSPDGLLVDSVYYEESFHHSFLNSNQGVSLERVDPEAAPDRSNWQSASGLEGYGTPTRPNSASAFSSDGEHFNLKYTVFSPDGDGYRDLLEIEYRLPRNGYLGKVYIYDDKGVLVKKLVNNLSFSRQGSIEWDGRDEAGLNCPTGIYILVAEALDSQGNHLRKKIAAVLSGRG